MYDIWFDFGFGLVFRFGFKCTFEVAQITTSDGTNAPLKLLLLVVLKADAA